MDKDVRELLIRQTISELRAKYCWYVSRGDYEKVAALYTPDGIFDSAMDGKRVVVKGTAALLESLKRSVLPGRIFPMVRNEVTFIKGNDVHGVCTMEARTASPDVPAFSGYYHDRFRMHDGKWRFSERRFFRYTPVFEHSGLDMDGSPETGLSAQYDRKG